MNFNSTLTTWMPPSCKLTTCHMTETAGIEVFFLIPKNESAVSGTNHLGKDRSRKSGSIPQCSLTKLCPGESTLKCGCFCNWRHLSWAAVSFSFGKKEFCEMSLDCTSFCLRLKFITDNICIVCIQGCHELERLDLEDCGYVSFSIHCIHIIPVLVSIWSVSCLGKSKIVYLKCLVTSTWPHLRCIVGPEEGQY